MVIKKDHRYLLTTQIAKLLIGASKHLNFSSAPLSRPYSMEGRITILNMQTSKLDFILLWYDKIPLRDLKDLEVLAILVLASRMKLQSFCKIYFPGTEI